MKTTVCDLCGKPVAHYQSMAGDGQYGIEFKVINTQVTTADWEPDACGACFKLLLRRAYAALMGQEKPANGSGSTSKGGGQ